MTISFVKSYYVIQYSVLLYCAVLLTAFCFRGGAAGRGYNYDDDYYEYKGPEEEEPYYYDDGGGQNGREWGGYDDDPYDDGRPAPRRGQGRRKSGGSVAGFDLTGTITRGNKSEEIGRLALDYLIEL